MFGIVNGAYSYMYFVRDYKNIQLNTHTPNHIIYVIVCKVLCLQYKQTNKYLLLAIRETK